MENTPRSPKLSVSAEHQVLNDNNLQKTIHCSWSSNLTDSFSYENKKCDDISDTCDYFENTNGEVDSLDSNHMNCDDSSKEKQSIGTVFLHISDMIQHNTDHKKESKQFQPSQNYTNRVASRYLHHPALNTDCLPASVRVTGDDVIITSGCSGAVEMAISVLLNEGDNILVPR